MALYDGYFDAEPVLDGSGDLTGYDREYDAGTFTEYFAQTIGSGVCVYNNPNSFQVRLANGAAIVSPGYLFIQGYWLKNDADYTVNLPGEENYAIVAHLNTGKRMIELEAVTLDTAYPDSLVLAIVSPTSAQDTRYNIDICGVIDSAGELSRKVEYAVNYIDTQIEGKLAAIDADIDAQAAKIDEQIAQARAIVSRITPPPIGTVKYTASQNTDDTWLRCDGSFINESDYPDLVAALGKLTPGVESVTELLRATTSEQMSNSVLFNGTLWVYLAQSKKLVGMTGTAKKEITVSGVDSLEVTPSIDIVLSVVDGAVYLAQNNAGSSRFILLECATFTGTETSIKMTELDTSAIEYMGSYYAPEFSQYIVPRVVKIGSTLNVAFKLERGIRSGTSAIYNGVVGYISWTAGNFGSAEVKTAIYRDNKGGYGGNNTDMMYTFPLCGFDPKNGNDMVMLATYYYNSAIYFSVYSVSQGLYGDYVFSEAKVVKELPNFSKNIIPVCGNNECLFGMEIKSRHPVVYHANYSDRTAFEVDTAEAVSLPTRSKLFKDSVVYAAAQGLWFVFVGTGLLFSESLQGGSWGFLDTQDLIGFIGSYGCLNYDSATNSLYISGMDSAGALKAARLKLPNFYNYANDGAFLPNLASDGVPAYIKALDEGNNTGGDYLTITVQEPTGLEGTSDFSNYAQVLFNNLPILPGTYKRAIADLGQTFTVGVKVTQRLDNNFHRAAVAVNGTTITVSTSYSSGSSGTATLTTADYISKGLTLQGKIIFSS